MEEVKSITQFIAEFGAFGALFIYLLRYIIRKNDEREKNYQALLDKISDHVADKVKEVDAVIVDVACCVKGIKADCAEIKLDVGDIKHDVNDIKRDVDIMKLNKIGGGN